VLQKINPKYPQPGSLLSEVGKRLDDLIPPAQQDGLKRQGRRARIAARRKVEPPKRQAFDEAWVSNEIKVINDVFRGHNVYDIKTQDPYMGQPIS